MLLTEEQARAKWCPHVRGIHSDDTVGNRHIMNSDTGNVCHDADLYRCIASRCMAWRFGPVRAAEWMGSPVVTPAMTQWVLDNPPPNPPVFTDGDDLRDQHHTAIMVWGEQATIYLQSLVPGAPPEGDGWEWRVGFDDEEEKPFAHWFRPAEKRGFCGLAGQAGA